MSGDILEYLKSGDSSCDFEDVSPSQETEEDCDFSDDNLNRLEERIQKIHAGFFLYESNKEKDLVAECCKILFDSFVRKLGSTPRSDPSKGWKGVGSYLGLNTKDIQNIDNMSRTGKECPVHLMLQTFVKLPCATFDKVIQALRMVGRLDVLVGIIEPLTKLTDLLLVEENKVDSDHGYYSAEVDGSDFDIIIPKFLDSDLIETPSSLKDGNKTECWNIKKPAVLLTYTEDGIDIAERILRNHGCGPDDDGINIVTLEDNKSDVMINPDEYIRHCLKEVDYVIPIITKGYIENIQASVSGFPLMNLLINQDCHYAKYIYTCLVTEYIDGLGCLNKKVRNVLPEDYDDETYNQLYKFPIFKPFFHECDWEKFMKIFFKDFYSNR